MSRFSIIIPVYNVEKYLRECLESVVNQIFADFEVICVNDGSTDNSLSVLEEFAAKDDRLHIITQQNAGLSAARNTGIRAAQGDYLFFLDSDDWIEFDALKIMEHNLSAEDMLCFNGKRKLADGKTETPDEGITEPQLSGWTYYNKYAMIPRKFDFVCSVLRLYKRSFLLDNRLFFKDGIYHEDNLFTPMVCYYARSVKVIPDSLYIYRIREGSISNTASRKHISDLVTINNELADFFYGRMEINTSVIYRVLTKDAVGLFNLIHGWEMDDMLNVEYDRINWHRVRKMINQADIFALYCLLRKKRWKCFFKAYYFDFYIYRKIIRKVKRLLKNNLLSVCTYQN
ncbi:MAG: glycosyltransferase [Prevotellaceae bacterium]|jgi:glycosyltransferase involved in cell wall biosynthesis|nr:glycosyltransferase [Prevotellaceae bacterium]